MYISRDVLKILGVAIAFIALAFSAACGYTQASQVQNADQQSMARQLDQYRKAQPPHFYTYSQDIATANAVMDARTSGKSTWSADFIMGVPDPIFTCDSRGYPLPADAEITNPDQITYTIGSGGGGSTWEVVPQIDPNGLYGSHATNNTWVVCVDSDGSAYVHGAEGIVEVWPFQMTWNYQLHRAEKSDPNAKASHTVPLQENTAPPTNVQFSLTPTPTTR